MREHCFGAGVSRVRDWKISFIFLVIFPYIFPSPAVFVHFVISALWYFPLGPLQVKKLKKYLLMMIGREGGRLPGEDRQFGHGGGNFLPPAPT